MQWNVTRAGQSDLNSEVIVLQGLTSKYLFTAGNSLKLSKGNRKGKVTILVK